MMKYEFEKLAGYEVSDYDYDVIIEPMYMATNLSKQDFVKCLDRKRFEVKHQKSPELIELENQLKKDIKDAKDQIKSYEDRIKHLKSLIEVEDSMYWIKEWKEEIKRIREEIRFCRVRISECKFVLGA